MAHSLAVVCEASADRETACGLADRVICQEVDWISVEVIDEYRQWRGQEVHESHLTWREVAARARQAKIKAHGHFNGQPGAPDAHAGRLALLLLKSSSNPPDGVVFIRDDDRQAERRKGLEQARSVSRWAVPIVIGLAHTKRECWVIAGFEPCSPQEQDALERLRQELGFDPRHKPEELTAKHDDDLRSAKRVLGMLAGSHAVREAQCWQETNLELLKNRGRHTGLAEYLQEVQKHLVRLFT